MKRTSIAWRNLMHDRGRTAVALAGLGFSLVVIFLQLGFLQVMLSTATTVLDKLDYDIMIVPKNYHYLADAGQFPLARLVRARAVRGVERVVPIYVRLGVWRSQATPKAWHPIYVRLGIWPSQATPEAWRPQSILVLGLPPEARPPGELPFKSFGEFDPQQIKEQLPLLATPRALLIDRNSRDEFGPQEPNTLVELNGEDFKIVGRCDLGTGFSATGAALLENHNFARAFGGAALDEPTLGLVTVAEGEDVAAVARRLEDVLPIFRDDPGGGRPNASSDVRVLIKDDLREQERRYWRNEKAIGSIFLMGIGISVIVGFVVVYQVLSSDIADHMAEYATLKALGATDRRIAGVVIEQALLLGLIGYGLALLASAGLYSLVEYATRLPMTLRVLWILVVPMFLAVAITAGSALLSVRKVYRADPAELFR